MEYNILLKIKIRIMEKRLFRSRKSRSVAGICGGLAEHLDIDPTIIRIVFVIGTLFTIFPFLLAYIILWIVIPESN